MKKSLIIIAPALIAGFIVLGLHPSDPVSLNVSDASRGPSFEVRVDKPRRDRPLFGILSTKLEEKLLGVGELRFGHASRSARIGSVGNDRLELSADGWKLFIETDREGGISPGTRLVFPIELAERQRTLRCLPAESPSGYLRTTVLTGSNELGGSFLVELATCEDAETGKVIKWPPAALTVRGSFEGLPQGRH